MKVEIKDVDYYVRQVESASFRLKVDLGPTYSAYTFIFFLGCIRAVKESRLIRPAKEGFLF